MDEPQAIRTSEGTLLWEPSEERMSSSQISRYMHWLRRVRGLDPGSYEDLWRWSVSDLEGFWSSVWDYFGVRSPRPYERVLADRRMPGAVWFPGADLNYAEHALRRRDGHPAMIFRAEDGRTSTLSYGELYRQTASLAAGLRRLGVARGDRVVAYLPNTPEAVAAFLAVAALGAVWSSCAPEFGIRSVVDRFRQIDPKVLLAIDGYHYGGKPHDRMEAAADIARQLPSLEATVVIPYLSERPKIGGLPGAVMWEELPVEATDLAFEPVPFDHPLWVLYSSGTTGLPKAIVQGHGGILLEHLKSLALHLDLDSSDRFFWFTTTGWMMWNFLVSGLLLGTTIVLYDGSPTYPDIGSLWRLADEAAVTYFGTSASFILSCMKAGIEPGRERDLRPLRALGSTGAPLPPEGFRWVYEHVKDDLLLGSVSGGTDVCTAFVGSCPLIPVFAGEIQCRCLGAKVEAFDEEGRPVVGEVGELVLTEPLPSMPLYLWDDPDAIRYRESYFALYPGVWRHGDWIKITGRGTCVIYGRSDSTLNRGGVRIGTSEFYRVVEEMPEVADSLVVDLGQLGGEGRLLLFVVLREGLQLTEEITSRIRDRLRRELSPRHAPDEIRQIPEIPRTLNFKKLEVPVKQILLGTPPERAVSPDAMGNPQALAPFLELAEAIRREAG